jgi:hypothetical protein
MTTVQQSHRVCVRTKFLPPTEGGKGSRIKATHGKGSNSLTISWDYELDTAENHAQAIHAYIEMMEWGGTWAIGADEQHGGYVAVWVA